MGQCYGRDHERKSQTNQRNLRQQPLQSLPHKVTRVQQVDMIKGKLKSTRDKIDNLVNQHQTQIISINRELNIEKQQGLKNKSKAIYLLKQRKDFQQQVGNLNIRKQAVIKTLDTLSQQQLDREMVFVLEQSNEYMRKVQDELERKNWREILVEAKNSRYNPVEFAEAEEDPEVKLLYAQLEREVLGVGNGPQVHVNGVSAINRVSHVSQMRGVPRVQYN